jgi:MFS family permease
MSAHWRFLRGEFPLLAFGSSFAFFSSFGQTFLISLFVPFFLVEFALGNAEFGIVYATATLGSAVLLPWIGSWLDRTSLIRFSVSVVLLMALSAVLLAISRNLAVFLIALLGLRLAGQGLSSHAAVTAMARYYGSSRGKALSISSLGYPIGEGVLPFLAVAAIGLMGWRQSWLLVAASALVFFGPLLVFLLNRSGAEMDPRRLPGAKPPAGPASKVGGADSAARIAESRNWNRRRVLRDPRFWFVLPAVLLTPFWTTGLILYQASIASSKGWSLALMASAFVGFALARIVFSLATGGAIDRFSARHIFPFCTLPLAAGVAFLLLFDGGWAAYAFMTCLGVTTGISGTAKSALWAELYGIRNLGAIKAMLASLMVVSTAASPVLVGFLLDGGSRLDGLLIGAIASVVVGSALALKVFPRSHGLSLAEAR